MAGKARIGQFSPPPGPYGGDLPVVRPSDNVVTLTAAQQAAADVAAAASTNQTSLTSLFEQLKAASTQ